MQPTGERIYNKAIQPYMQKSITTTAAIDEITLSLRSFMQKQVRNLCRYIDSVGAYFMVSNSTAPFVHELYQEFNVDVVSFNRGLAENRKTNAKTSEVLATNY